jgi:hypothetical protein
MKATFITNLKTSDKYFTIVAGKIMLEKQDASEFKEENLFVMIPQKPINEIDHIRIALKKEEKTALIWDLDSKLRQNLVKQIHKKKLEKFKIFKIVAKLLESKDFSGFRELSQKFQKNKNHLQTKEFLKIIEFEKFSGEPKTNSKEIEKSPERPSIPRTARKNVGGKRKPDSQIEENDSDNEIFSVSYGSHSTSENLNSQSSSEVLETTKIYFWTCSGSQVCFFLNLKTFHNFKFHSIFGTLPLNPFVSLNVYYTENVLKIIVGIIGNDVFDHIKLNESEIFQFFIFIDLNESFLNLNEKMETLVQKMIEDLNQDDYQLLISRVFQIQSMQFAKRILLPSLSQGNKRKRDSLDSRSKKK